MGNEKTKQVRELAAQLRDLCADMLKLEATLVDRSLPPHEQHRRSAGNLAHYLALRQHDIRILQQKLAGPGLSSLGRTESHVLNAIETVRKVLHALAGMTDQASLPTESAIDMAEGSRLLTENTHALLGPKPSGRNVRIMVTMPTEASTNYELVRDLVESGTDCIRINCAHDGPDLWMGMIPNLQRARKEAGRPCRIESGSGRP